MLAFIVSKVADGEMRARIVGVDTPIHTFDFLFGVSAGNLLLHHTHKKEDVLMSLCGEDNFKAFYACVLKDQASFQINGPTLPRK